MISVRSAGLAVVVRQVSGGLLRREYAAGRCSWRRTP